MSCHSIKYSPDCASALIPKLSELIEREQVKLYNHTSYSAGASQTVHTSYTCPTLYSVNTSGFGEVINTSTGTGALFVP